MARHLGREKWQGADFTLVGDPTLDDTLVGENGKAPFELVSKIAITSTRDNPTEPLLGAEIYLINPDGTDPQRLTDNFPYGDSFPTLSPDGKKIAFDSNRLTADSGTLNISDLFVMDADGTNQELLTRGSSATWSPNSNFIAFHASADYYASGGSAPGRHRSSPTQARPPRTATSSWRTSTHSQPSPTFGPKPS
jgi:hypothetical protein